MRIETRGIGYGPPLLLLHGLASSPRSWARTLPSVERHRRVLLGDLFDDGDAFFSLAGSAEKLAAALATADEPADLVGHSLGGLVALHLAARRPELVARLVLVDVPALPHPGRPGARALAVAGSAARTDLSSIGLVLGSVLRRSPVRLLSAARATMRANVEPELDAVGGLPTLLVWGERDTIVPLQVGEALARRLPSARLVVIPGAGHQPMWEAPDAFNRALEEFLDRAGGGSRPRPPAC
jgi:pimeloyl-ACP methyl ester carboxylesterase